MKRYIERVGVLLLAAMLISCGGGGADSPSGGSSATPSGGSPSTPPSSGGNPSTPPSGGDPGTPPSGGGSTPPSAAAHFEESDTAVTLSAGWTRTTTSDSGFGWSGGTAVQSSVAGATATFTFTGTSVRWLASRGRAKGIALVRVDGGRATEVDLFARPNDEIRTPAITIDGLTPGQHTLTIEVTGRQNQFAVGNVVEVDAFEVQPQILSHFQETDPDVAFVGTWAQADTRFSWSGSGAGNVGDPVVGAKVTETAGSKVTVTFRGTSIKWIGYSGPDAGIARVTLDGQSVDIDTYSPALTVQQVVYTSPALADATHTLTIEATGLKNDKSTAAKIFVDAFDVTAPGRRYQAGNPKNPENPDPDITYDGAWNRNVARVWSEGAAATSSQTTDSATFTFNGTGVSWIGCEKASIGKAKIFLDGVLKEEVNMNKPLGIEGFQRTIYRVDGLTKGLHTLRIEVTSTNGAFIVVDAFDVRE